MDSGNNDDIIYADLVLSPGGSAPNPSEDKTVYTDIAVFQPKPAKERQGLQSNVNEEVEMTTQNQPLEPISAPETSSILVAPQSNESSPPAIDNNRKLLSVRRTNIFCENKYIFRGRTKLLG